MIEISLSLMKNIEGDKMKHKGFKTILLIISIVIFGYHIFNLISLWSSIPDRIAIHFTNDTPDNWGPKYALLIMPIISLLAWFLIGLLIKNPEKLNYVNLTEANKEIQYSRATKLLILIQHLSFLVFIFANEVFLNFSIGTNYSLPFIISLTLSAICLIAPIYLLIWAATLKY